jgi:SAM-dependent methyltransferase
MTRAPNEELVAALVESIGSGNPMHARSLLGALADLTVEERHELEDYVTFCVRDGWGIERLADAYRVITEDTLREQIHFRRTGRYRHSTFDEVSEGVYFDPEYMSKYMYGLALTLFLWPNHLQIVRFFRRMLPKGRAGRYLEIGPGHGAFFRYAARHGNFASCLGVDISPTSLGMTRRLLNSDSSIPRPCWQLLHADFLEVANLMGTYAAIVMGEVLEHVERPLLFLQRIRALAEDDAFIFITTAVNAPAVDHIYLFRSVDEVRELAEEAGLRVVDQLATPYSGCSMEETIQQRLPINVAMVLAK